MLVARKWCKCTLCFKNISDIFDSNLNKNYQTFIILVWIFITQLAIKWPFSFSPHPMTASALPRERKPSEIHVCIEICKNVKNTPNIIDRNLKHDYQISTIFGNLFLTQLVIKWLFEFPPHPLSASAVPGEIRSSKILVEMIKNVD